VNVLSIICWIITGGLVISNIVDTFITLIDFWGIAGAVVSCLLLPIALFIHPVVRAVDTGDALNILTGYFRIGAMIGFGYLASYLWDKYERAKERRQGY